MLRDTLLLHRRFRRNGFCGQSGNGGRTLRPSSFEDFAEKRRVVPDKIQNELGIEPMENPFEYVKEIRADFDYSKIKFTEEYYDVLGLEFPG